MGLPLHRIRESPPASADPHGQKLMKTYGMMFLRFIERLRRVTELRPPQCTLLQYYKAMWHFFHPKLSNGQNRRGFRKPKGSVRMTSGSLNKSSTVLVLVRCLFSPSPSLGYACGEEGDMWCG